MRSRERAWAAVSLGLQRDSEAVKPLWERITRKYTGKDKVNVPAGILCGLGLIGDESIRPERLVVPLAEGELVLEVYALRRMDLRDPVISIGQHGQPVGLPRS